MRRLGAVRAMQSDMADESIESLFDVTGMSCANCVRHVDHALKDVPGVTQVDVQLASGEVRVRHDGVLAPPERLVAAIVDAGYEAKLRA